MKLKIGGRVKLKGTKKTGLVKQLDPAHPVFKNAVYVEIEPGGVWWCVPADRCEKVEGVCNE